MLERGMKWKVIGERRIEECRRRSEGVVSSAIVAFASRVLSGFDSSGGQHFCLFKHTRTHIKAHTYIITIKANVKINALHIFPRKAQQIED